MCSCQFQSVNQKGDKCRFEMLENRRQDSRLTQMSVLKVFFFFSSARCHERQRQSEDERTALGRLSDTLSCPDTGQTLKSVWTLVNLLLSAPRWTGRAPG